jgi:hypothetical protein
MSKILCTMPGRVGDIFWSLPAARAIAAADSAPVDFCFSVGPGSGQTEKSGMKELLEAQPYIHGAWVVENWVDVGEGQLSPAITAELVADLRVVNLHYRGWPQAPLAQDIAARAGVEVDLSRPWILPPQHLTRQLPPYQVVVGFSDEWAELKAGLVLALMKAGIEVALLVPPGGSRLVENFFGRSEYYGLPPAPLLAWHKVNLPEAAVLISKAKVFVGCLSSLAVLAAGLGRARVLVEPSDARQNPIFQHWDQPLITGGDGKPTFDSRELVAAVERRLEEQRA